MFIKCKNNPDPDTTSQDTIKPHVTGMYFVENCNIFPRESRFKIQIGFAKIEIASSICVGHRVHSGSAET